MPALIMAAAIALSACTISIGAGPESDPTSSPDISPSPGGASTETPTPEPGASVEAPGRLAIVGADGSLVTMRPDGSDRSELAEGGVRSVSALQPTWSPDGRHIAWVVQDTAAGLAGGSIVIAGPRGEDPVETPTPFVPYYLSWDPTGSRIAFLGNAGDPDVPVQMGLLDATGAAPPRDVTGGSPFLYFSWGPDGRHLLAHSGFDTLERIDLSGEGTPVTERPGLFPTPAWSSDGRTVVYAERGPDQVQRLVAQTGSKAPAILAQGAGSLSFVLRPDGGAVAYQLLDQDDTTSVAQAGGASNGGVRIVDLRTGRITRATEEAAVTFWWSPKGGRLLALIPGVADPGTIRFNWQIFDGRPPEPRNDFHLPTQEVMQQYAPFFTQYAQSTTPWAPDGSAFAYASVGPNGLGQIVVESVESRPVVIAAGVFVTWSPSGA